MWCRPRTWSIWQRPFGCSRLRIGRTSAVPSLTSRGASQPRRNSLPKIAPAEHLQDDLGDRAGHTSTASFPVLPLRGPVRAGDVHHVEPAVAVGVPDVTPGLVEGGLAHRVRTAWRTARCC